MKFRGRPAWISVAAILFVLTAEDPARGAYPGANGRIAYVLSGAIWTVNPDGSAPQQLTSPAADPASDPSWSPDGGRIAFSRGSNLYVINADGSGEALVTTNGRDPTWSPDGAEIAFLTSANEGIYRINADGTNRRLEVYVNEADAFSPDDPAWNPSSPSIAFGWQQNGLFCDPFDIGECEGFFNAWLGLRTLDEPSPFSWSGNGSGSDPDWSPAGIELVHTTARVRTDWDEWHGTDGDIAVGSQTIVSGPELDWQPAWSPDGSKIVFARYSDAGLWTVSSDGSNPVRIVDRGTEPDWQPVQRPYARPKSATPVYVQFVPAFEPCAEPNRAHGGSLSYQSCNPPQATSPNLSVSAGEVLVRSVGSMRVNVLLGNPGPPDDTDVGMQFNLTNVLKRPDYSDYTGIVQPEISVRMTDRSGFQRQTTQDFGVRFSAPCTATPGDTSGSTCALTTTVESLVPGAVAESTRSVWALDRVRLYDGGPTGDGDNESLFLVQGVFVP